MEKLDARDVFALKYKRQNSIKELEYHVNGDCIHMGKISPACAACFDKSLKGFPVYVGNSCPQKCPMCYYGGQMKDEGLPYERGDLNKLYAHYLNPEQYFEFASFNTNGESFLYLEHYKKFATILNDIEDRSGKKIYRHMYTNGVYATEENLQIVKDMRVDELRFHVSASDFSEDVLDNMRVAKEMGFTVSVEEPSWFPHKEKLLKHMAIFQEIGISHLNLIEVQLTIYNKETIEKAYPNARYYQNILHHVYDEGLVYDLMQEKIDKGYTYSILDCSSDVEKYRRSESNYYENVDIKKACR